MDSFAQELKQYMGSSRLAADQQRQEKIQWARRDFRAYCNLVNPAFFKPERLYQDIICNTLQQMYEKKIIHPETQKPCDILIVNLPPGFGKSYSNMVFATWAYGQNIRNKIISISYNQTLSLEFAKGVRDMIQDEEIEGDGQYFCVRSVFPELKIKYGDSAMEKWSLEGKGVYRSYLSTSFDGSITGMRGDIIIIDDPIKNEKEAVNTTVKDAHWQFFTGTLPSRVLPGGIQIVTQTRWATDDLAGRIISDPEYGRRCHVLEMQALTSDDEKGVSLCEDLYPTEDLQSKRRSMAASIWAANFMQTPVDIQGALYSGFGVYDPVAVDYDKYVQVISYSDTADEGADFLSSISAGVTEDGYIYVLDIYHTDAPMETTEPELARRLDDYKVRDALIESNNGGRGFARNVIGRLREKNNHRCNVTWFHQTKNKKARILVNAAGVQEKVLMPEGWEMKYPAFYKQLMGYQRKGKNAHDDAADALTGLYEFAIGEVKGRKKARVLKRSLFGI